MPFRVTWSLTGDSGVITERILFSRKWAATLFFSISAICIPEIYVTVRPNGSIASFLIRTFGFSLLISSTGLIRLASGLSRERMVVNKCAAPYLGPLCALWALVLPTFVLSRPESAVAALCAQLLVMVYVYSPKTDEIFAPVSAIFIVYLESVPRAVRHHILLGCVSITALL